MTDSFTVKGRQLVVKEVPSSDPDIIKYDVFDDDMSVTKNLGFTAPREFFGVPIDVSMWQELIKAEVIRIASGD